MIIVCHIRGIDYSQIPLLEKILWFGNYGVELFLFVSGIGMYFSLTKTNTNLGQWYKRRYIRITVPFILIAISIYPLRVILNIPVSFSDFFLYITTLEFWIHHRGAWYVAMLFPLYFTSKVSLLYRFPWQTSQGTYTSGRKCISIFKIPSPAQASQRPPFTLKLNRPFLYPLALASDVAAKRSRIMSKTPV